VAGGAGVRERVEAAARDLLRTAGGFADPSPFLLLRPRLIPGSASLVRAYAAVAEREPPRSPPTAVVAVTVGRTGEHPTDLRLLPYSVAPDGGFPAPHDLDLP
jgi:hypothetical protein